MDISELKHVIVGDQKNGSFVLILQDGAVITAEDKAMLQALYSRSPASVLDHLEKLAKSGSGKFMGQFYVGYGHKSIGDCGDATIFIENVSMLVAKAVQDTMLYNGQEVSTRYLDFSNQPFVNPLLLSDEKNPQTELRRLYLESRESIKESLKMRYPLQEGENESVYDKAINARSFDILRSVLPAGAQTNLSWTTNLRQFADRLEYLRVHPLPEVVQVAEMLEVALKQMYPNSFNHKRYGESEAYRKAYMEEGYYFDPTQGISEKVQLVHNGLDERMLAGQMEWYTRRPPKTELPKHLAESGTLQYSFGLDFGSYRDIARQRAVVQRMPLLTMKHGFHSWYREQMPKDVQESLQKVINNLYDWYDTKLRRGVPVKLLQYYVPMGFVVPCRVTGDLPALVYLVELRSGSTVHATLRNVAQQMGNHLRQQIGIPVHIDESDFGRFDVKRGKNDIVEKK